MHLLLYKSTKVNAGLFISQYEYINVMFILVINKFSKIIDASLIDLDFNQSLY
jgi:hypothetical protein